MSDRITKKGWLSQLTQGNQLSMENPLLTICCDQFDIQAIDFNITDTYHDFGVVITHIPSGVTGMCCEYSSQPKNKSAAFKQLTADPIFKLWIKKQLNRFSVGAKRTNNFNV